MDDFSKQQPAPRAMRALLALGIVIAAASAAPAAAFSSGSPVCEVNQLPLVPMSPVLRDPPPVGWRVKASSTRYFENQRIVVEVTNSDPARRARGVLLWAKSGPLAGAGRFVLPPVEPPLLPRFQFIPFVPGNDCGEWALSHADAEPKLQSQLRFDWIAPAGDAFVAIRAFVIDDCLPSAGGCRGAQALTEFVELRPTLFYDDFEAAPLGNL